MDEPTTRAVCRLLDWANLDVTTSLDRVPAAVVNLDEPVTVKGADGFSERMRVRSNNFLPTLDYIWAGF